MLYHLIEYFKEIGIDIPGQGLFGYLSFRAIAAFTLALLISIFAGRRIIAWLQKKQIGETIRDLGLEGQLQKKGTPTMGGIIIFISVIIPVLLLGDLYASIVVPNIQTDFFIANANTIRAITVLLAIFFIVMGCRAFLRMLTASMRKKLGQAAVKFAKKLAAPLIKAVNKLLLSIGIDLSRRNRLGGRDEKTFVFDDTEKVKKTKKKLKNDLKWVDQTDNAARVRFIFIDYMIRRIKKGYFMKRCMTPAEIGSEIALEDDEKALFAVYDKARYAGQRGVEEITDAMVGELQLVNRKRNQ